MPPPEASAQPQAVAQIRTPEGWTAGVYANGLSIWSTAYEVTLDFFVSLPPGPGPDDPAGGQVMIGPHEIVARVKIPPPLVMQLTQNLAMAQEAYEAAWGEIPDRSSSSG